MKTQQLQLIRQEAFESIMQCMESVTCFASDLEAIGHDAEAEDFRELAGYLENFVINMRTKRRSHP